MAGQLTIDDLPNEVLGHVLKYIPFMQSEEIMLVSKRWGYIIDELVGIRTYIGRPSEFWSLPINDWHPFEKIATVGASTVSFSDIEHLDDQSSTDQKEPPFFKHPYLVRRVSFDGYLQQSTFIHLTEPIRNLAYLELHLSSLEGIDLTGVELNFPKLQELIISSNNYTLQHMASRNLGQIMVNCTNLLEAPYFPRLVTLRLYIPIVIQRSAQLLRALFKFLVRHNATMTMFLIRTEVTVSLASEENYAEENADSLELIPEIILLKTHKLPLPVFRATFWAGDLPFLEFFRGILNQQKQMTWCGFVTHEDFRPFPQQIVKQNYLTLQKLHLSIGVVDSAGNGIEMNCAYLQECIVLEHIGFIGNRTKENSLGVFKPDLINAHILPKTLKFVEIYNILITMDDVRVMAVNLPKLKTLHLENIGEVGELGMNVETLVDVIDNNCLHKIGILSGFNSRSLHNFSSKDTPAVKITRIFLRKEQNPSFVATLHNDGRTEWGYTEEDDKFT